MEVKQKFPRHEPENCRTKKPFQSTRDECSIVGQIKSQNNNLRINKSKLGGNSSNNISVRRNIQLQYFSFSPILSNKAKMRNHMTLMAIKAVVAKKFLVLLQTNSKRKQRNQRICFKKYK